MQKATRMLLLVVLVFCAFLVIPKSVFAEEGANNFIRGEMEFIPAKGNHLGDVILLRVKVYYDRDLVEFDQAQIPQALDSVLPKLFRVKDISHNSWKEGNFVVEIWDFKLQFLDGLPPLELRITSLSLQYRQKLLSYFSSFEIGEAKVFFDALTSGDSIPDPIIKKLDFGPDKNIKAAVLFGLSALFILVGIGFGVILFLKRQKAKRKIQEPEPIDEFLVKYNLLRDSLNKGEKGLIILHELYILLRSFYKERRGLELKIDWQNHLIGEEKILIEALQKLYDEDLISKAHACQLLQDAKKILEKQ